MGTIGEVQRLLASIVLSVIGLLPVAGTLSEIAARAPQLPACCRAHGKHECAMRLQPHTGAGSSAEPGIYPVCGQYPFLPAASLAGANASIFAPKQSELFDADVVSQSVAQLQDDGGFSGCFERSHLTRGPPSFLS